MNKILGKSSIGFILLLSITLGENPLKYAKPKLSDYGFFIGNMADHIPRDGVLPYDVSAQLFSDYALKSRFIVLPNDEQLSYKLDGSFDFPRESILIKTFYYPEDFRKPKDNIRLMETRLLIHTPEGWMGFPYVWNEEQTEAILEIAGERMDASFIDKNGGKTKFEYVVPNFNQCKGCHVNQNRMIPIGHKVRLLNHEFDPTDGSENERARAWIDINCAHCHRLGSPGETSGLFLNIEETDPTKLGIMKPPVAAGRGAGDRLHTIVPGEPEKSIMIYRMESTDPGIMMPELGRKLVHKEGVELVRKWIKEMK